MYGGGGYGGGGYGGGGYGGGGRGRGRGGGRGGRGGGGDFASEDPNSEQFRKLFIGGLSYETDDKNLREHFEQWGEICDCVVMRDPQTKRSRGFGFITYKQADSIDAAQNARPHNIDNRTVDTKRAMPRDESSGGRGDKESVKKMFVGGLKDDTTEDQVRETFAPFGNIEEINLIKDKATGNCKGFGFITFDDFDSVDKCVLKKRHELNGRRVEVKKAQAKGEGGERGGRGGGRGGRGGHQDYGGGYANGGGYGGGGYGGGPGGGYGGGQGYGGGYDSYGGGGGDYGGQGGGWGGQGNFGSNYQQGYGGGAMRSGGGGYGGRSQGPYGGGASGGGGYGGSGGYGGGYGGGGGYGRR